MRLRWHSEFSRVPLRRGLLKKREIERLKNISVGRYRLWNQALASISPQTDKLPTCIPLERSITQCRYREGGQGNPEITSIFDFPRMLNLLINTLFCHRVGLTITCLIKWWTVRKWKWSQTYLPITENLCERFKSSYEESGILFPSWAQVVVCAAQVRVSSFYNVPPSGGGRNNSDIP